MTRLSSTIALLLALTITGVVHSQQAQTRPLRIIAFGAHPDDAELKAAGVAALWAAKGHKVKFVAMTNGDVGHFEQAGGPLAQRRYKEVQECARILGITTDVLDIHDGELEPTLEYRRMVARMIRDWQADIVMGHRPYDYHPDHRYTGVLMDDAAVVVVAPFFVPDTTPTPRNPLFFYYSDGFEYPAKFVPTIVVDIDASADKKWQCVSAMPSQFGDKDSWQGRTRPDVPKTDAERPAYLLNLAKQRTAAVADQYRDRLVAMYGEERGRKVEVRRGVSAWPVRAAGIDRGTQDLVPVKPGSRVHRFTGSQVQGSRVHWFSGSGFTGSSGSRVHCSRRRERWADARGAACWQPARHDRDEKQRHGRRRQRRHVVRRDAEQQPGEGTCPSISAPRARRRCRPRRSSCPRRQHDPHGLTRRRAERLPDRQFRRPPRDSKRHHAGDSYCRQHQREPREDRQQRRVQPWLGQPRAHDGAHRADVEDRLRRIDAGDGGAQRLREGAGSPRSATPASSSATGTTRSEST